MKATIWSAFKSMTQRGSTEFIRSEIGRLKDGSFSRIVHPRENPHNNRFNCDICTQVAIYHIKREKDGTPVWVGGGWFTPKTVVQGQSAAEVRLKSGIVDVADGAPVTDLCAAWQ
jgi:hypothetical protein